MNIVTGMSMSIMRNTIPIMNIRMIMNIIKIIIMITNTAMSIMRNIIMITNTAMIMAAIITTSIMTA